MQVVDCVSLPLADVHNRAFSIDRGVALRKRRELPSVHQRNCEGEERQGETCEHLNDNNKERQQIEFAQSNRKNQTWEGKRTIRNREGRKGSEV